MRKDMMVLLMVVICGAFLAGGCAKKELVKGEEAAPMAKSADQSAAKGPTSDQKQLPDQQQTTEPTRTAKQEPLQQKQSTQPDAAASLENLYFDYDSYVLSPAARESLNRSAENLLKKNPSLRVQVEGNCDERGSDEYNLALGEKRARAAYNYLVTLGVPAARLSVISYGEEKPADPGHDEAAWAKNRRVEFTGMK